jgi:F0F1-type ATP synthase gamma subunit
MTSLSRLESRLVAWTNFRDVTQASKTFAAMRSRRWLALLAHAERYLALCSDLAAYYVEARDSGPRRTVVLAIGTDLGMCGALNARVAAAAGERWQAADLRGAVGLRLASDLPEPHFLLPAPSSFEALEATAARIAALAAPTTAAAVDLEIVLANAVGPDGSIVAGPLIERQSPATNAESAIADLTPPTVARETALALQLHARLVAALTRAAASESEARWRTMHRAHEAADRRIAERRQELRKVRSERLTQEMLEARQGAAGHNRRRGPIPA